MVAMTKRVKTFQVVFSDPSKTFYCGGDKVSGRVEVEVTETTRVSAVKVAAVGSAKVEYAKGKQRCRQEAEYLRHEEVLRLSDQPTGKPNPSARSHLISANTWLADRSDDVSFSWRKNAVELITWSVLQTPTAQWS